MFFVFLSCIYRTVLLFFFYHFYVSFFLSSPYRMGILVLYKNEKGEKSDRKRRRMVLLF